MELTKALEAIKMNMVSSAYDVMKHQIALEALIPEEKWNEINKKALDLFQAQYPDITVTVAEDRPELSEEQPDPTA